LTGLISGSAVAARRVRQATPLPEAIVSPAKTGARVWKLHWTLRYGFAAVAVAAAASARYQLQEQFIGLPYAAFLPAVLLVAFAAGLGPALLATALAAAYTQYPVILGAGSFAAESTSDIIRLLAFVSLGTISALAVALLRAGRRKQMLTEQALLDSEELFRQLVDGVDDYAIFMLDRHGQIASWNTGAQRIEGWSEKEILGQDVSLVFPPEARDRGRPNAQLKLAAAHGTFREEAERVRKDGSLFWADVAITALRDEKGDLRGFAQVIRDISERKRASREMAESRARLASVLESAMDAIITVDGNQRIVLFNKAAVTMFNRPESEAMGMSLEQLIPHRFRSAHALHVAGFAATLVTNRPMGPAGELTGLRSNGEEFPVEASISQAEVNGRRLFTVILRDITARRRAEEHQALLLRELAHRVKNTLAVVQSIAAQTRRFAAPEQFYQTLTGRLAALATAHDLLTRSDWEGAALGEVVRLTFAPYEGLSPERRWTIEGPKIWLAPNEAVTLSLVFHELATNAAKFGALSNASGRIEVHWDLDSEDEPAECRISWRESGGPKVSPPTGGGFGSKLLDRAVRHELGGQTQVDFAEAGVAYRIRIPLSTKVKVQS
jgi:PAS domain S-box-containing protein